VHGATVTVFKKSQDFAFRFPLFLSDTTNASEMVSFSLLNGTYELDVTATGFGFVTVGFSICHPCRCSTAHLIGMFPSLACLSCLGKTARCGFTNRHRLSKVIASTDNTAQCSKQRAWPAFFFSSSWFGVCVCAWALCRAALVCVPR
jgi:hypothetical protein